MMEIRADKVKELREKSGAGLMDCKRALQESGGDLEKAHDFLRKAGVVKAAKKAGRTTLEGLIGEAASADRQAAVLVEVNCETDFVARTDPFQKWVNDLSLHLLKRRPARLEELLAGTLDSGEKVQESLTALIAQLGENMGVRRFAVVCAASGEKVGSYLHMGAKIGAIVRARGNVSETSLREVAMHVAALQPRYLDRAAVPPEVLQREREIVKAQPELMGKEAALLDKIVEGKLNRFYSEVCLTDQPFIKDPTGKKTVLAFLKGEDPKVGIVEMVRFQVGGEIHG